MSDDNTKANEDIQVITTPKMPWDALDGENPDHYRLFIFYCHMHPNERTKKLCAKQNNMNYSYLVTLAKQNEWDRRLMAYESYLVQQQVEERAALRRAFIDSKIDVMSKLENKLREAVDNLDVTDMQHKDVIALLKFYFDHGDDMYRLETIEDEQEVKIVVSMQRPLKKAAEDEDDDKD